MCPSPHIATLIYTSDKVTTEKLMIGNEYYPRIIGKLISNVEESVDFLISQSLSVPFCWYILPSHLDGHLKCFQAMLVIVLYGYI